MGRPGDVDAEIDRHRRAGVVFPCVPGPLSEHRQGPEVVGVHGFIQQPEAHAPPRPTVRARPTEIVLVVEVHVVSRPVPAFLAEVRSELPEHLLEGLLRGGAHRPGRMGQLGRPHQEVLVTGRRRPGLEALRQGCGPVLVQRQVEVADRLARRGPDVAGFPAEGSPTQQWSVAVVPVDPVSHGVGPSERPLEFGGGPPVDLARLVVGQHAQRHPMGVGEAVVFALHGQEGSRVGGANAHRAGRAGVSVHVPGDLERVAELNIRNIESQRMGEHRLAVGGDGDLEVSAAGPGVWRDPGIQHERLVPLPLHLIVLPWDRERLVGVERDEHLGHPPLALGHRPRAGKLHVQVVGDEPLPAALLNRHADPVGLALGRMEHQLFCQPTAPRHDGAGHAIVVLQAWLGCGRHDCGDPVRFHSPPAGAAGAGVAGSAGKLHGPGQRLGGRRDRYHARDGSTFAAGETRDAHEQSPACGKSREEHGRIVKRLGRSDRLVGLSHVEHFDAVGPDGRSFPRTGRLPERRVHADGTVAGVGEAGSGCHVGFVSRPGCTHLPGPEGDRHVRG